MKILHLSSHCHEIGNGIMNVAVDIACHQAAQGHDVAFASAGGSYVPLIEGHGVTHRALRQNWRAPFGLPRALLGLRAILRELRPDIVHAHMMTGALLARALRLGAPWRLVSTVHNEWQRSAIVMGCADRVIAVSAAVAERMERRGIARRRIDVVRNGPLDSPRRTAAVDGANWVSLNRPAILTVAGLYERKGIADLIAAFDLVAAGHPTASLTIVGAGPDRAAFEATAQASPHGGRIHFTGFVADPRPFFAAADIFVLASRSEPFGLVLAEAREAGCAVIGCDVGGIPEALEYGRAGILSPPNDPAALASAIDRLIGESGALEWWQAESGRNLGWLSARRVAEETAHVYRRALAPSAAPAPAARHGRVGGRG